MTYDILVDNNSIRNYIYFVRVIEIEYNIENIYKALYQKGFKGRMRL